MRRNLFSHAGLLVLTGAVLLATPAIGWAQRGGGGHGGGGGGYRGGGYGGSYHMGGYGGYHSGGYGYYSHPYYGGYHTGFYRPYFRGGFGYYPYYDYGYSSYDASPYYSTGVTTDPGFDFATPAPSNFDDGTAFNNQSGYIPPASVGSTDPVAHVTVNVPADAKLWLGDTLMTSTGSTRPFDSPSLTPGMRYTYDVKASWTENGREVTQTQQVEVGAGARVNVNFPAPPRNSVQASAGRKN